MILAITSRELANTCLETYVSCPSMVLPFLWGVVTGVSLMTIISWVIARKYARRTNP